MGGAGRSKNSDTESLKGSESRKGSESPTGTVDPTGAPNVSGRAGPIQRLGEAKAEHIGPARIYDATRSESSSRTAVATWRRATQAASISIGIRKYAPW